MLYSNCKITGGDSSICSNHDCFIQRRNVLNEAGTDSVGKSTVSKTNPDLATPIRGRSSYGDLQRTHASYQHGLGNQYQSGESPSMFAAQNPLTQIRSDTSMASNWYFNSISTPHIGSKSNHFIHSKSFPC